MVSLLCPEVEKPCYTSGVRKRSGRYMISLNPIRWIEKILHAKLNGLCPACNYVRGDNLHCQACQEYVSYRQVY